MYTFLIVGLGNPGKAYVHTRHNLGYQVIDAFAESQRVVWEKSERFKAQISKVILEDHTCLLAKPERFMNLSGLVVQQLCSFYQIAPKNVIVLQDDINVQVAELKISTNLGHGGHNGIANIIQCIGAAFTRFRIGIGQKSVFQMDLKDYVLGDLTIEEKPLFSLNFPVYNDALKLLILQGSTAAMNKFNKRV